MLPSQTLVMTDKDGKTHNLKLVETAAGQRVFGEKQSAFDRAWQKVSAAFSSAVYSIACAVLGFGMVEIIKNFCGMTKEKVDVKRVEAVVANHKSQHENGFYSL